MKFLQSVAVLTVLLVGHQDVAGVEGQACLVPPYALLYPPDLTAEELESTVLLEGKCYLACLEEEEDATVKLKLAIAN